VVFAVSIARRTRGDLLHEGMIATLETEHAEVHKTGMERAKVRNVAFTPLTEVER
jgi:hypothetical protein